MQHAFKFFSLLALVVLLINCKSKKESRNQLEYKPLMDLNYSPANIAPGSEIELLAFSGGEKSDENTIYYYQFIGIDRSSGDTVRIICSLISVDKSAGIENKTFTTPLQYDPGKGVTTAEYQLPDSSQQLLTEINADASSTHENLSAEKVKQIMEGKSNKKELVVINKSIDLFQRDYKAAMGVLNFKKIPW